MNTPGSILVAEPSNALRSGPAEDSVARAARGGHLLDVMRTRCCWLLACFFLATFCAFGADGPGTRRIDIDQYEKLRAQTNAVVLDVRSKAEFEKGHIPGAVNIDISSLRFDEQVGALDKSKTYLVNCAVGMRSARACKKMQSLGFTNLYNLAPGFDGWKKAGKPVEK
jgi:rhodanese-related sulfurtransferase